MSKLSEQTLVLIKPDGLKRGLAGEIIKRLERVGLKITNCQMRQADEALSAEHYPVTDEWLTKVGNNAIHDCEKYGFEITEVMGTADPKEIGQIIHSYNKELLMSAPVLALVFEGPHAVEIVRKLVGHTIPVLSSPGTIRGDFSSESAISAGLEKRTVYNLIHASGSSEEAQREIKLWFS